MGIPDPKNPPESISASDKAKRDFYKFPQPNGQTTQEWEKKNEEWRNTPRKDKDGNIIGSELRCNTVFGRELSKLGIDVAKDANMNTIIEGMEQSGDWADLPVDKNGNTDHATALKLAQEGYIVAATEKGEKMDMPPCLQEKKGIPLPGTARSQKFMAASMEKRPRPKESATTGRQRTKII